MPLHTSPAEPVAFLCAVLAPADLQAPTVEELVEHFGPVRERSGLYPFAFTDYYEREMGGNLVKEIVSLGDPINPSLLAERKLRTIALEHSLSINGKGDFRRRVNVDPGLLSLGSLVLATTKSSGHRIAIAPSLYAEVTLLRQQGSYQPFPWTYEDYQVEPVKSFLECVRQRLRENRLS
ncbi:MAG: DUF4416 family protein [Candidatus Latescibacterota bacterium]|nr:DUF4416 family protein [Candidatus Latescibacterota bacterium]